MNWFTLSLDTFAKLNQLFNQVHNILYPLSISIVKTATTTFPQLNHLTDSLGSTLVSTIVEFLILLTVINFLAWLFQRVSRLIGFLFNTFLFWTFIIALAYLYFKLQANDPFLASEKKRAFQNLSQQFPLDPKYFENMPEEIRQFVLSALNAANQAPPN
ncbi:hypothetical protein BB561_005620 [Smittium simulii]|uniref:Uncharacterized protein n=1 Tax=Smittium simulii TaxID=133385 RepID=A0A2T9Y9H6_9FUNG|nr:hypothetical protein BB561_005620 [Smittium simulii]